MVYPNGKLSCLQKDRVDAGIDLYKAGKVEKLLMSGDNRSIYNNQTTRMMQYAIRHGVPAKDVAMDVAGRRTYDSVYRAKHTFGLNEYIVVSQRSHVDRTLFLSRHMGANAYGFASDRHRNIKSEIREFPACAKAFLDVYLLHPTPILGQKEHI